jgi:hypothetical protein
MMTRCRGLLFCCTGKIRKKEIKMNANDPVFDLTPNQRDAYAALEWLQRYFESKVNRLDRNIKSALEKIPPEPKFWQMIERQIYDDAKSEHQRLDLDRSEFLDVLEVIKGILSIWRDKGEIDFKSITYLITDLIDEWAGYRFDRAEVLDVYHNIAQLKPFDLDSVGD